MAEISLSFLENVKRFKKITRRWISNVKVNINLFFIVLIEGALYSVAAQSH